MASEELFLSDQDEDSLRFLFGVCHRDPASRAQGFEAIRNSIDAWIEGYGSPRVPGGLAQSTVNGLETESLLRDHLPGLLRLSVQCPFDDVRASSQQLLADLEDRGAKVPYIVTSDISLFIPQHDIVEVDTEDEKVKSLFIDDFLQNNRLDNVTQLMGFHPEYLDIYLKTSHYLLREDGPLPFEYRHYIAIMAAGRHQCTYLMSLHAHEFLLCGGDPAWLKGLEHIPKKLRDLYEVNKILAHRPWNITQGHIAALARGADNWSMSELMHAIILLAHFHALSSFVFGCGINKEVDHPGGHSWRMACLSGNDANANDFVFDNASSSPEESIMNFDEDVSVEVLMERMRQLHEEQSEASQEELIKRFEKVEIQSVELTVGKKKPAPQSGINRFIQDAEYAYIDFAQRESHSKVPTFRVQDYSWEDHGFSLANRLYSDIGNLLDEKFTMAYNLTYYTMGHNTEVDTSSFRLAIWNYIHCMYGIRHDDYDYGAINHLLERNLKAYIKTVTCYPERLTKKDYDGVMREFKHSEKVHVNLMLLEARMQAELLYALRAVMKFMT